MKKKIIKISPSKLDEIKIEETAKIIKRGGIVIFPTETVYGIGALMNNKRAINKIYQLRKRPQNKALLILVSSPQMAKQHIKKISFQAKKIIKKFWPGPLTIIFEKNKKVPNYITAKQKTVAIRMPGNEFLLALIKKVDQPIVAPSANISGKKSPIKAQETKDFFGKVDLILDGGPTKYKKESTILDSTVNPPKILREGAMSRKKLERFMKLT